MKIIAYIICYLIYPLSFLFPRSRHKYVFGSYRGSFADNAKYLFLYSVENGDKDNRYIWLSTSRATVRTVRKLGLPAYWTMELCGIWHALTSKYWFFNSYTSDIMFCLSGGACGINLWHGVGLKRIEFNSVSGPLADRYSKKNKFDVFCHPESFRRPDWLLTSTPFQTSMFAKAFRLPESRCLELGYPRNWILNASEKARSEYIDRYEPKQTREFIDSIKDKYEKIYVYMPTWRDSQRTVFTQSMDLERLNAILAAQKSLLILKPHANVILTDSLGTMSNITLVDPKSDIYPILPYANVLITDYSSILYDWLLMERKDVILYLYDYKEYVKERDFYYPFDENVAGKRVYDFDSFCSCLQSGDYTLAENDRKKIVEKFWGKTATYDVSQKILGFIKDQYK